MGASALFDHPFNGSGEWSTALVYGANLYSDSKQLSNSIDLETTLDLDPRNSVFERLEYVSKDAYDLVLGPIPPADRFNIASVAIGYTRGLTRAAGIAIAVGGVLTLDAIPSTLASYYGTHTPWGLGVFLRFRPGDTHGRMDVRRSALIQQISGAGRCTARLSPKSRCGPTSNVHASPYIPTVIFNCTMKGRPYNAPLKNAPFRMYVR